MDELDELQELLETPFDELGEPVHEGPDRSWAPILAGVAVSLMYVVAIAAVAVGLLRFTRDHVKSLSVQKPAPGNLLARLPFRR